MGSEIVDLRTSVGSNILVIVVILVVINSLNSYVLLLNTQTRRHLEFSGVICFLNFIVDSQINILNVTKSFCYISIMLNLCILV